VHAFTNEEGEKTSLKAHLNFDLIEFEIKI